MACAKSNKTPTASPRIQCDLSQRRTARVARYGLHETVDSTPALRVSPLQHSQRISNYHAKCVYLVKRFEDKQSF